MPIGQKIIPIRKFSAFPKHAADFNRTVFFRIIQNS